MKQRDQRAESPKKGRVGRNQINFEVTKDQLFVIKRKAERAGVSLAAYLRQMAIHGKIVSRLTEEERQLFKELVGLSNDLRRLVRMAEEQGARTTMLYFTRYGDKIDVLINRFSHDQ